MKTLDELKAANLPRLTWADIITVTDGEIPPDDMAAMDAYFRKFVGVRDGGCIRCGAQQGGDAIDAMFGRSRFRWGLAHGEGTCSTDGCGYPARALHYDVGPLKQLSLILQYHPDDLRPNPKRKAPR